MRSTDTNYGRLVANRYRLLDLVGKGAMGRVYRAEDTLLGGVTVAVKFLSQSLLNQSMRDRFVQEATVCARLGEKSLHIVRVTDYGVDMNNIPFYVMEFLEGDNLNNLIKLYPLELPRFLKLTRQIFIAVERAHQGIVVEGNLCRIVHRDLKPSNIIVLQDPTLGELVKVVDFGIAQLIQDNHAQTNASFMGTMAYCSPEQMDGKDLDNRSDIYSLGILMYEMLSSEMPLSPENQSFGGWYQAHYYSEPKPFNSQLNIPPVLEQLILKCLAKAPGDRPQNIAEMLPVLEGLELGQKKPIQLNSLQSNPQQAEIAEKLLSLDQLCERTSWPQDKPQQKIVFPRLLRASNGTFPILQAMLNREDIIKYTSSIRYNRFLFLPNPHPMLLWLTVLYHPEHGPRWLPCYLDLKEKSGQQVSRLLGKLGNYPVLLFALGKPQNCQHIINVKIVAEQCQNLQEWADQSKFAPGGQVKISKKLLKEELHKLKPQIIQKLATVKPHVSFSPQL